MAKGNRKRKKAGAAKSKGKFSAQAHDGDGADLIADEITALSSIFQEDFKLLFEKPSPLISIVVRPLTMENVYDSQDIFVELLIRSLPGYPHKAPKIQIQKHGGLSNDDIDHLLPMLLDQSNSNAREGRIMIFNLVEVAQEFLSDIIPPGQAHEEESKGSTSLEESHHTEEISGQDSFSSQEFQTYCAIDLFGDLSIGGESWKGNIENETCAVTKGPNDKFQRYTIKHRLDLAVFDPLRNKSFKQDELEKKLKQTEVNSNSSMEEKTQCKTDDLSRKGTSDSTIEVLQKICLRYLSVDDIYHDKKDLIMVYLLRLLCSSRASVPNVLPELISELQGMGILPQWAGELANLESELFKKAFQHVFHCCNMGDSNPILNQFWKESIKLLGESSTSPINSRYLKDFEEICLLGRGGFGHVVLCINKLDGRQYAVKKIRLKESELSFNDKILREVATLSRVQHQQVVRYFQAWIEAGVGSDETLHGSISASVQSSDIDGSERVSAANYLYIQMEYCPGTLRKMFDKHLKIDDKELVWNMFRQIVEGLAHIHGQGIIHRDLTPNNIFFDARNDIKIGDFGLAKFSNLEQLDRDYSVGGEINASIEGTGQVGTYFYTAPEIEKGWPHINEKVDMYSLGVVLFELWHPFATAMERYIILSHLKLKSLLPAEWVKEHSEQAALVKQLMSQNPLDRPSALHVLRNELPPRMEDESLNDVLRTIQSSEDTYVFDRVIQAIFDEERILNRTNHQSTRTKLGDEVDCIHSAEAELKESVVELAKEVFVQHGAKRFESKLLRVTSEIWKQDSSAVKLLNSSGDVLELSHELRYQFACWVALKKITSFKRYEISHIYRRGVGHSAPNSYLQGDFDIIGGAPILAEAEIIKVVMDIVGKFFDWDVLEIHLNHACIFNAVLSWAGVRNESKHEVAKLISLMCSCMPQSSIRKSKWALIRRQLLQGLHLPEFTVDRLQVVERRYSGNLDEVLARLRGALPPDQTILSALEELSLLLRYLRIWKIETHVLMDTLMPPTNDHHKGIYFQAYLLKESFHVPPTENALFAVAGRYDWFFHHLRNNNLISNFPGAVGVSIALEKILSAESSCRAENGFSVLVCSRGGGGLLNERMELVAQLWAANIKAEFVCHPAPSLTDQYEYANERRIKWLSLITDAGISQGSVKVRHIELKKEIEVPKGEIIKYFTEATFTLPFKMFAPYKSFPLEKT